MVTLRTPALIFLLLREWECKFLDFTRGEPDTGSICDIAVRDHVTIRGSLHRRVVLVAMNTEPLDNRHFHMFSLSSGGQISPP
jgi:hypothetical protein